MPHFFQRQSSRTQKPKNKHQRLPFSNADCNRFDANDDCRGGAMDYSCSHLILLLNFAFKPKGDSKVTKIHQPPQHKHSILICVFQIVKKFQNENIKQIQASNQTKIFK
jgi:hypothetical protein